MRGSFTLHAPSVHASLSLSLTSALLYLCRVIHGIKLFYGVWGFKTGAPQQIKEFV